jgi:hypothetical protein
MLKKLSTARARPAMRSEPRWKAASVYFLTDLEWFSQRIWILEDGDGRTCQTDALPHAGSGSSVKLARFGLDTAQEEMTCRWVPTRSEQRPVS